MTQSVQLLQYPALREVERSTQTLGGHTESEIAMLRPRHVEGEPLGEGLPS